MAVKLSDKDIENIRKYLGYGVKPKDIAEMYGISIDYVNKIKSGNRRGSADEQQWP